ncbi:Uncharacterised protein [Vibrio cholerae]|nr:Uncharacterised protein [Vibrio cholerae]
MLQSAIERIIKISMSQITLKQQLTLGRERVIQINRMFVGTIAQDHRAIKIGNTA